MVRSGYGWTVEQRRLNDKDTASRMQLVLMARAEAMLPQASAGGNIGSTVAGDDLSGVPDPMLQSASKN